MMFIKVDLPEPDDPITATNSPSCTCNETVAVERAKLDIAWPIDFGDLGQIDDVSHHGPFSEGEPPQRPRCSPWRRVPCRATSTRRRRDRLRGDHRRRPRSRFPSVSPVWTGTACGCDAVHQPDRMRLRRVRPRVRAHGGRCDSPDAAGASAAGVGTAAPHLRPRGPSRPLGVDHRDVCRHAGTKLEIRVVSDVDDRVVGDDVLNGRGGISDLSKILPRKISDRGNESTVKNVFIPTSRRPTSPSATFVSTCIVGSGLVRS